MSFKKKKRFCQFKLKVIHIFNKLVYLMMQSDDHVSVFDNFTYSDGQIKACVIFTCPAAA